MSISKELTPYFMVHQDLENELWSWSSPVEGVRSEEIEELLGDDDCHEVISSLELNGYAWADCSEWEGGIYVFATTIELLTNTIEEVQTLFEE